MMASGMILPEQSGLKLGTSFNEPFPVKSGVISKTLSPAPPPASAARTAPLSRRYRKNLVSQNRSEHPTSRQRSLIKSSASANTQPLGGLGLEVKPNEIIWRGWEPGEEYTKSLTLKNIHIKTQKIRYKVPSSRFFSTLFPQVIVLSAGTSFTLPLTFKPLEKIAYDDRIEFITSEGTFSIVLRGLLPETNLHLPESLHFGLVAAHDNLEIMFELKNMSTELMTNFSWEVPEPFTILPPTGSIPPRGSCSLKAIFRPLSASVFETHAICCYGEDNLLKKVKLEGIGKYPHLLVNTSDKAISKYHDVAVLDFKEVRVHDTAVRPMILKNLSHVRVPFKIQLSSFTPDIDRAFICAMKEGIVPPSSSISIPICYNPNVVGQASIDYFEVSPIGISSKSIVKCQGNCKGPAVSLSLPLLNFGLVSSEKEVTKTIDITNNSKCEAVYQILLDPDSTVWHTSQISDVLKSGETRTLHVCFTPIHPINYYRRLVILVHDQGPLYVDLIGTCHSGESQPPLLKPIHLDKYKIHSQRGISFYSPEILFNLLQGKQIKVDDSGCLMYSSDENEESVYNSDPPLTEYFDDAHNSEITHNPPHVSLDKLEVWLGQQQFDMDSENEPCHATLRMTNHTKGKITAIWMQDPTGVFELIPSSCDIPPLKSTDFRVVFRPNVPNQFFGAELECYASYKSMRDYKLVDDTTITPPWCLTVSVSGHTFSGKNNTFLPNVEIGANELTFAATPDNEDSYRTMLLKNNGTTPVLYQFNQNSEESSFTIKPQQGMMKSKYHISVCRLTPRKVETYESKVTLRLNDNGTHDEHLTLIGTGEQPELLLSNSGEMYFRPTCIGTMNTNKYTVQNTGRLPLGFMWKLQSTDLTRLSVEPKSGVIYPNEIQNHTWTYSPDIPEKSLFKPVCYTWPHNNGSAEITSVVDIPIKNRRKFTLRVIGEGHTGEIRAERSSIDFSCVICGSSSTKTLVLHNVSNCDARFKLSIEQFVNSQYGENPDENETIALYLNKSSDVLPSHSRTTINIKARPHRRVLYTWSLYYELINEDDEAIELNNRILLCELSAEGVYPNLEVIDARTSGSGASISKTQLWRWFSLDSFNSFLDADPEKQELIYSVSTRRSTSRQPSVHTRSILEFNFGAAPLDSESCFVSLMLRNTGSVVSEWAFLFPKDLQLPMDYWTETGVFDADELHELHIQDNKLFTVSPKKGKLNPGQNQTILLQYKHDIAGTHRIPVLFKLENGREILLNFVGVTVEPNRRYIHFPGSKHSFTPVPIGGPTPPRQLYEIYNGGSMAVMYELNVAPLVELQTANFDHPILTCLNPQGEVLPGTCTNVEFIFSPLEAKTYMVDIPIHIVGGDVALISFSGIGYDARVIGSNMPMLDQPPEFSGVPKTQTVPVPGQHVFLSEERISFGNIPLFSRKRHVFFLTNKSTDRPMRFSWHASSETVNDVLRIEPVHGRLEPGEHKLTRITFCAAGQPSFYDLDLICEVIDEIKMQEYHAELLSWEEEKAKQEVEFTITDQTIEEELTQQAMQNSSSQQTIEKTSPRRLNLENVLNKNLSPMRLTESVMTNKHTRSETKKYKTLPPIRFEDPLHLPSDRSRVNRKINMVLRGDNNEEWPQPLPPEPFVSHLGITARTHDISEFRTNFPHEGNKHYIDRMLQVNHPLPSRSTSEQYLLTTCDKEEKDTVIMIMSKVIRSLLDDPTFHDSVRGISEEKTPYFKQLAKEDQDKVEEIPLVTPRNGEDGSKVETSELMDQILRQEEEVPPTKEEKSVTKEKLSRQSSRSSKTATSVRSKEDKKLRVSSSLSQRMEMDREIKRSPVFGSMLEEILSSTISNIMTEAVRGEVVLTARPRVVALPPSTVKQQSQQQPSQNEKNGSRSASSRKTASTGSKKRKNRSHASSSSSFSAPASTGRK
ncbi:cilia- and flagella-associated protein 65-like [Styela clava]